MKPQYKTNLHQKTVDAPVVNVIIIPFIFSTYTLLTKVHKFHRYRNRPEKTSDSGDYCCKTIIKDCDDGDFKKIFCANKLYKNSIFFLDAHFYFRIVKIKRFLILKNLCINQHPIPKSL